MNENLMKLLIVYYSIVAGCLLARALAREIRRIRDPRRNRIVRIR